jgi:hypothetical protein
MSLHGITTQKTKRQASSVDIATGQRLDDQGSIPIFLFNAMSRLALGPT